MGDAFGDHGHNPNAVYGKSAQDVLLTLVRDGHRVILATLDVYIDRGWGLQGMQREALPTEFTDAEICVHIMLTELFVLNTLEPATRGEASKLTGTALEIRSMVDPEARRLHLSRWTLVMTREKTESFQRFISLRAWFEEKAAQIEARLLSISPERYNVNVQHPMGVSEGPFFLVALRHFPVHTAHHIGQLHDRMKKDAGLAKSIPFSFGEMK